MVQYKRTVKFWTRQKKQKQTKTPILKIADKSTAAANRRRISRLVPSHLRLV